MDTYLKHFINAYRCIFWIKSTSIDRLDVPYMRPCQWKWYGQSTWSSWLKYFIFNKNLREQVSIPNRTIFNYFSNFIPNKLDTFHDKDPL